MGGEIVETDNLWIKTKDWFPVTFDNAVYESQEYHYWLSRQALLGAEYHIWPVMDDSEYGMSFLIRFEDPMVAEMFKLKFKCQS